MKKLYEDHHYSFDKKTRIITFKQDNPVYLDEKKTFAENGVDIDKIKTVNEYDQLRMEYRDILLEAFQQKWRKVKPKNIEQKYEKALSLFDIDEVSRLKKVIEQKRRLNIKAVN